MGKREVEKYLKGLEKEGLVEQLMELYQKFPIVKEYYDFAFDPKEDKLLMEAKTKISQEYFPLKRKRPKARRSVAQKYIKHFLQLGMDPHPLADLMLYNLEVAQTYEEGKNLPVTFYKSMLNSFKQTAQYISYNGLQQDFAPRIVKFYKRIQAQKWPLMESFSDVLDLLEEESGGAPL